MLEIKNLKIVYGDLEVINGANLQFCKGITSIVGRSGCGKTSILNAIMHQIPFQADNYLWNGVDLLNRDTSFFRNHFAYITQKQNFISDLTCFENIRLFVSLSGETITDEEIIDYLKIVDLENITSKSYPDELSGGEKQKIAIAQILAKKTDIILCDEITASLDEENKNEVFALLQKLATEQNKIIIMASHDEDIYNQSDCIYRINENGVVLEKSNDYESIPIIEKKATQLPSKIIHQYIQSKINRKKWYAFLYSIITATVVSLCAFLTFFTFNSLAEQNKILDRLSQNQIYIINQTEPVLSNYSYSYYPTNHQFEEDVVNQLQEVEGITSMYPYFWMSLIDPQAKDYQDVDIVLSYEDKEDKKVTVSGAPFDFSLIPYYEEQNFNHKMTTYSDEKMGVYINHIFLLMTGLSEDDLKGATIKLTAYAPISYTVEEVTLYDHDIEESSNYLQQRQVGTPVEIELPIIGFVDFWYNDDWGQSFIYCPISYMQSFINENNVWQPNAYLAFVDDLELMEEVNLSIRSIDEKIATGNKYMDNKAWYQQKRYVEITAIVSMLAIMITGLILSYVYGIYHYQHQQNDVVYFKRNYLTNKEFNYIIKIDIFYENMINILFSIPLSFLITYFGIIFLNMFKFGVLSKEALIILILVIVYSTIQTIFSRIYYIKKVSGKK